MADNNIQIKINAAVEGAQAAQTIGALRKSLQELQTLASQSDIGTEQFELLQQQISATNQTLADSRDRLGDISDKIRTLEGTPVERLKGSFGLLKEAIFNLDFDKAKIGAEGLVNAFTPLGPDGAPLKGLAALSGTLKGVGSAVSSLGSTFLSLGKALLTNPLFLLAGVIAAISVAVIALLNKLGLLKPILDAISSATEIVTDAFNNFTEAIGLSTAASDKQTAQIIANEEKQRAELQKTADAYKRIEGAISGLTSTQIAELNKITGIYVDTNGKISAAREEAERKITLSHKRELEEYDKKVASGRKLTDDEKKKYDELVVKITDSNLKIIESNAQRFKDVEKQLYENALAGAALEENELIRARKIRDIKVANSKKENLDKITTLQENKKLIEELNTFEVQSDAVKKADLLAKIDFNNKKIKSITDKTNNELLAAEQDYQKIVKSEGEKAATNKKQRLDKEKEDRKKSILDEIIAEENKVKLIKEKGKERTDAEIKLLEFIKNVKINESDLFFETENQKQAFIIDTAKKIEELRFSEEERLKKITEARIALEQKANSGNILYIEQSSRARIAEIDLLIKGKEETEEGIKLQSERLDLIQKLSEIQKEDIKAQEENVRKTKEARIQTLKTILDNNIKVNQEILADDEKTAELIKIVGEKTATDAVSFDKMSSKERIATLKELQTAQLDLLQFNKDAENASKLGLQGSTDFLITLDNLSIESTKSTNAQKLAIVEETNLKIDESNAKVLTAEQQRNVERLQEASSVAASISSGYQSIADLALTLFDQETANLKKGSVEEEKAARKRFEINKALSLGGAIIDGFKAVTTSLASAPLAVGVVPNPIGIASLAATIVTTTANIAKILATQYKSSASGGGASQPTVPSINSSGLSPEARNAAGFTPQQFFGLGRATAEGGSSTGEQKVYVLESDITRTQNRVSVIESRSVIG